jgi:hypothetical protein
MRRYKEPASGACQASGPYCCGKAARRIAVKGEASRVALCDTRLYSRSLSDLN